MSKIILASKSAARRALLKGAQVPFVPITSHVNEGEIKLICEKKGWSLDKTAMTLAIAKAKSVAKHKPNEYVVGADQILGFKNIGFDKPKTMAEAAQRLAQFSGQTHFLHTAVCVVRDDKVLMQENTSPELTMRQLKEKEILTYLDLVGEGVLGSVGAYHLEGPGIRLFEMVKGDYFSILGLPLLPLLAYFRTENLLDF